MLVDTREQSSDGISGFNPNVQNGVINAKATSGDKFGFVLLCIITLGIFAIFLITKKNYFNRTQIKINERASGIQVQLAQRRDTLIKLVDATKSSMDFEKGLLTDITKLRSQKITPENLTEVNNKIEDSFGRLLATFEQYPKLSSTETIKQLMNSAEYLEEELAASRRLYNAVVSEFNQELFQFPGRIPAASLKLHTLPMFNASSEQQKDVSLKM
ncbi:MAG: LemA family protein [Mycoplasmoidaceae bacterium]|nr:LemA family protein [Mycoplasmoidaceae bacterium]